MMWSKLKQLTEEKFADSVRKRVEIFSTRYNKPNSSTGRGWITIDGIEVVNFSTMKSGEIYCCIYHEATSTNCLKHPAVKDEERTPGLLIEEGEFSRFDLHNCCFEYLNLTVEEGLAHPSPLINLLAVLDSRLGKRRLPSLAKKKHHPLVMRLLEFRLVQEGFNLKNKQETNRYED
ncbi:hypothetical protein A4H97_33400 [Niastella yeongjuensis]|uniref:Uncharacterized protein n=1 Tax=Niastella yeongjuensis TaxID=354355 RepID=A0A1V9EDX8_9BACT|nr:hypothetical protein [Niastella yeongjuensis]OQP44251.1 hypothetical protein A4H97_33400 [Niastella yeongjuensis]SEO41219.1 hypothetical protein SAMN05660816_02854 [Niastella yeongjuensis]